MDSLDTQLIGRNGEVSEVELSSYKLRRSQAMRSSSSQMLLHPLFRALSDSFHISYTINHNLILEQLPYAWTPRPILFPISLSQPSALSNPFECVSRWVS
jgi:hypothetical protein